MKPLIVESHYRSRLWYQALKSYNPYVISVNRNEYRNFIDEGLVVENILDISDKSFKKDSHRSRSEIINFLSNLEEGTHEKFSRIISSDRRLRELDADEVYNYLFYITKQIIDFLSDKDVCFVVMEPTWAHELFIHDYMSSKGIIVVHPRPDRFIPELYCFFIGKTYKDIFPVQGESVDLDAVRLVKAVRSGEKPSFFSLYLKRHKFTFDKILKLVDLVGLKIKGGQNYFIHIPVYRQVSNKIKIFFRSWLYKK